MQPCMPVAQGVGRQTARRRVVGIDDDEMRQRVGEIRVEEVPLLQQHDVVAGAGEGGGIFAVADPGHAHAAARQQQRQRADGRLRAGHRQDCVGVCDTVVRGRRGFEAIVLGQAQPCLGRDRRDGVAVRVDAGGQVHPAAGRLVVARARGGQVAAMGDCEAGVGAHTLCGTMPAKTRAPPAASTASHSPSVRETSASARRMSSARAGWPRPSGGRVSSMPS